MARKKAGDKQLTNGVDNTPNAQADHDSVAIGGISIGRDLSGEVNIAAGDIIKNVKTIHQRALTAAEEAERARKLESKLLAQGIVTLVQNLSAQASEGTESESPYKGLLPYGLNEAEIFHGRNKAKKDLLAHIKQNPLTVLHAESGAGKSSLLQAGIAAQLIANGHLAVYLRPRDSDPADFIKRMFLPEPSQAPALAKATLREFLRQVGTVLGSKTTLYLLLDQFEEFFNLLDKNERQPFLESLADCLSDPSLKVRWVLALRAEALSKLAELETVGIAPFKNMYSLHRLSRAEAQEAMIKPSQRHGIVFEPALIDHILDTLTTNGEVTPTHLQLVCSALTDDLTDDQTLTLQYYIDHEGDTEGILRDYLKRQLEHLPPEEQAPAWKVLRALITADRLRDLKTYDELVEELKLSGVSKEQIDLVLARLVERRLLATQPATTETFELAHDYLVKEIELDPQEQARKAAQELLVQETRSYQRHKTLLTAERLAVIEPYRNELRLSAEAEVLLSESRKAVQEEQRGRERRRNITLGVSSAVAIAMSLLAVWGFRSSQDATKQAATAQSASSQAVAQQEIAQANAEEAQNQANIALSNQLTAKSQTELLAYHDRRLSLLFAIEAINAAKKVPGFQNIAAEQALRDAIHQTGGDVILSPASEGALAPRGTTALSPLGDRLAIGYENKIYVWNLNDPQQRPEILPTSSSVGWLLFSPDGKFLVMLSTQAQAEIWDMENLSQKPRIVILPLLPHGYTPVEFSPDGGWLLINFDTILNLSDVNAKPFDFPNTFVSAIGLQGRWLVTRDPEDGYLYLSDTYDPGKDPIFLTAEGDCDRVMFSPDGRWLASGCNNVVKVWDVQDIEHQHFPFYFGSPAAFSPDATRLAIIFDGTIRILDLQGNRSERVINLYGQRDQLHNLRFSPDNLWIAATDAVGTIFLWDLTSDALITLNGLGGSERAVSDIAFTADSRQLISVSDDGITRKWDLLNPYAASLRVPLKEIYNIDSLSFSSDGRWLAINGWHTDNGHSLGGTLLDLKNWPGDPITLPTSSGALFFSPNGDQAISVNEKDNKIRRWDMTDIAEGNFIPNSTDVPGKIIVNVQDNHWLISQLEDNTIQVQDLLEPNVKPKSVSAIQTSIADSSTIGTNEKWLWVVSKDQTVQLWDLDHPDKEPEQPPIILKYTHTIKISPSGNLLATISNEDIIQLWDLRKSTQEPIISLQGDARGVFFNSLIFSSDEHWLVLNKRTTIQILDLQEPAAAKPITLRGLKEAVGDIVLSSNGHWLAGTSANSRGQRWETRLWNLQDPTSEPIILQQEDQTRTLVFSPDARWLAIARVDGKLELLRLDISEVSKLACEIVGSNLSRQQWEANFGPRKDYQKTCPQWPEGTDKRIELPGG